MSPFRVGCSAINKPRNKLQRNRIIYAVCIFSVILLGLASRSRSSLIPSMVKEYAGDVLWALAVYLMFAFLFSRLSIRGVATITGLFSLAIEISQLYHAPWIDSIRRLPLGGLVLGFGFLWSDLVCYFLGISTGMVLEWCWQKYMFSSRHFHFDEQ